MKKIDNKAASNRRKLLPAAGMLAISAVMLSTSTYAWFTMNKTVKVTGMEMKAHAEEGLLINEVATATDANWDEEAKAGDNEFIALRPASTKDGFAQWWHANSLKSSLEAGMSGTSVESSNTVAINSTDYYAEISSGATNVNTSPRSAVAGSTAARTVFYKDASFGSGSGALDNGEGFYVMYTYYLKSSKAGGDLTVAANNFEAKVIATRTGTNSGSSGATDLANALRVGIQINDGSHTFNKIFAPFYQSNTTYYVTGAASGGSGDSVTAYPGNTPTSVNDDNSLVIPDVNQNGIPVYVYIWMEGEDENCKSDNLTEYLDDYKIDITFNDTGLYD